MAYEPFVPPTIIDFGPPNEQSEPSRRSLESPSSTGGWLQRNGWWILATAEVVGRALATSGQAIETAPTDQTTTPDPTPTTHTSPVDEPLARLINHPSVILVTGRRGSGKSALAIRLQELLRDTAAPYAVGLPAKASHLLPGWYGLTEDPTTIPNNAVIYIPESYRFFHARGNNNAQGQAVADLVNISRHRRHTLIFDVQNPAHLDRNIVSEVDLVLLKEPGPLQEGFERPQFKGMMDSARAAFATIDQSRKKRAVVVAAAGSSQTMENKLPSFWTDALSRVFNDASSASKGNTKTATPRRGQKPTPENRKAKAQQMKAAGHSYSEIGHTLGISKSYVAKLVSEQKSSA